MMKNLEIVKHGNYSDSFKYVNIVVSLSIAVKKIQPPILLSQVKLMLLCWECLRTGEKHGVDMYRGKSSC